MTLEEPRVRTQLASVREQDVDGPGPYSSAARVEAAAFGLAAAATSK
jgi:hypothetical protein